MAKLLAIDNYDNFVYTLVDYLRLLGASATVVRNSVVNLASISSYDDMLVPPGPGTPAKAGAIVAAIKQCAQTETPVLGVCLGHQALARIFDGVALHAPTLVHRRAPVICHNGRGLFGGLPSSLTVGRYHSLAAESDTVRGFAITARTDDGVVMDAEHTELPLWGVRLYPESVLTQDGHWMLASWLAVYGQPKALEAARRKTPLIRFDE